MQNEWPYAFCKFPFFCNGNICPFCHHSRDIHNQNVHGLDLVLYNEPRSNVNMPIESLHATFYIIAMAMFALSVTVCEINLFFCDHAVIHLVMPST